MYIYIYIYVYILVHILMYISYYTHIHLTTTRIAPGRAWEAKVIIISTEGLHNNMFNGGS